ncbi:neuromedin-U receptor 2-like [Ruditapes philippinarum]|uniref:neuromedin-U receptor 2-like n=1 Tax=Ruditapes philippinarum TaxID=129788 RepID=UPI00295AA9D0|nr:neuromedin-U receptor 2-like [Ruditapes philippinarum]
MSVAVNGSICSYTYEEIDELIGKNITEDDILKWPCELVSFWIDLLPFVTVVKFLLSYGTSVIVAAGVFGNIVSLFVLVQSQMRKNPPNLYLTVLAVYDSCTLVFNFMVGVLRGNFETVNHVCQDSETLCTVHSVVVELFNILSVWIIVAFTVERYVMIRYSLKVRPSRRKTCFTILFLSFVIFLISLHKIGVSGFEGDSVYGYKACKTRRLIFKEIIAVYVALNTWLPTMIIALVNVGIILELRISRKLNDSLPQKVLSEADNRTTKLLLLVSTRYLLLVLPLGIVQTTELIWNQMFAVTPDSPEYVNFMITKLRLKWTRAFFFFFYQFNFAINIIIYVASPVATQFRSHLCRVFRMKQKFESFEWS